MAGALARRIYRGLFHSLPRLGRTRLKQSSPDVPAVPGISPVRDKVVLPAATTLSHAGEQISLAASGSGLSPAKPKCGLGFPVNPLIDHHRPDAWGRRLRFSLIEPHTALSDRMRLRLVGFQQGFSCWSISAGCLPICDKWPDWRGPARQAQISGEQSRPWSRSGEAHCSARPSPASRVSDSSEPPSQVQVWPYGHPNWP
jgi:hypothetical protein